jgi:pimeloyl-ACP methyl ester carboxylesterase
VVLVHGSVTSGWGTWASQRPLAERFELVVPVRSGYPPGPPLDRIDFERQADELVGLLEPGDHLVGHSYGGIVAMLAAAALPDALRSLAVLEPPAFGVARGHPAVEDFCAPFESGDFPREPRAYLEWFLARVGSSLRLPDPLPPELEAGARAALAERMPYEAEIPFEALRSAPFPKLVVSGAHHPAFDAVADVLERELGAERVVLPGAGHALPRLGEALNAVLADFFDRATGSGAPPPGTRATP